MRRLPFGSLKTQEQVVNTSLKINRLILTDKPRQTVDVTTRSWLTKFLSGASGVPVKVKHAKTTLKYYNLLKDKEDSKAHVVTPLGIGDAIAELIALCTESDEPQIVTFEKGSKGHFYLQSSYLGVCEILDTSAVSKYLEYAFLSFPSLSKTIISKDLSDQPVSAVINFNDNVRLAPLEVYEADDWRIFVLTAMTDDPHALAGQLPHMVLQNLTTGRCHTMRPGIGYLNLVDTPGKSILDTSNEIFGAWSWILADALAKAHLRGDQKEVKRLERSLRLKFGRFFFTGGGFVSRDVLQPLGRLVYPRTAAAFMVAYFVLVALIVLYLLKQLKAPRKDDAGPGFELLQ